MIILSTSQHIVAISLGDDWVWPFACALKSHARVGFGNVDDAFWEKDL